MVTFEETNNLTSVVADLHNDMPFHVCRYRRTGMHNVMESRYLHDIRAGGVNLIFCAVFLEDNCAVDWKGYAIEQIEALLLDIEESSDIFTLCESLAEIQLAIAQSKIAIVLAMEGCEPINSLDDLHKFHNLGLRMIGPTWARNNRIADACSFSSITIPEKAKGGLTPYGLEILHEAHQLGMIIDTSHISEETFWDILQHNQWHVLATHTNAQSVNGIRRNFTDTQIKALIKHGGIIGLNGMGSIVAPAKMPLMEAFIAHINHIKNLAGSENIALGIDLCRYFEDHKAGIPPDTFDGYKDLYLLKEAMDSHKFAIKEISGIMGENVLTYLSRIMF